MSENWKEQASEPARLMQDYERDGLDIQALTDRFHSAGREPVRLAAALTRYLMESDPPEALRYYLARRIRPAAAVLIERNQVSAMELLEKDFHFTAPLVDSFLQTAITLGRPEMIAWLMRRKEDFYGFSDRDFTL